MKRINIKLKIAVWMGLLLMAGMVLLDMVMVFASQRFLLDAEREKGVVLVELIGTQLHSDVGEGTSAPVSKNESAKRMQQVLTSSNTVAAMWMDSRGEIQWIRKSGEAAAVPLRHICRTAMERQSTVVETVGDTWGVFWRQKRYLAVAGPIFRNSQLAGISGAIISLEPVFSKLRNAQKIMGYYLLVNAFILSLVGLYRIHQLIIRPIQKIIGRAEAFRPGDVTFTLEEAGENEISKLSRAINRVFDLNREDQQELRRTVSSLEDAMIRLKHAQQEIIRAEKLATVGRLSSGIAHEIGNPVGIVIGYLELIKQGIGADAEAKDYISRAEDELGRIRAVIRQLLDYSRPSEESRKPVSVHILLEDALQMARVQPLFADLQLESDLAAEHDVVSGDPDQLKQLFLNFILNAADAIKVGGKAAPGRLRITSEYLKTSKVKQNDSPGILCIQFEDNGAGITKADLDKIFDPFFTTKPPGMGSGLGLWVSLLIAESMGGSIEAESNPGDGTRMILRLPVEGAMP